MTRSFSGIFILYGFSLRICGWIKNWRNQGGYTSKYWILVKTVKTTCICISSIGNIFVPRCGSLYSTFSKTHHRKFRFRIL
jgi:hypothetical protein